MKLESGNAAVDHNSSGVGGGDGGAAALPVPVIGAFKEHKKSYGQWGSEARPTTCVFGKVSLSSG